MEAGDQVRPPLGAVFAPFLFVPRIRVRLVVPSVAARFQGNIRGGKTARWAP